jgi:hypothetical protein
MEMRELGMLMRLIDMWGFEDLRITTVLQLKAQFDLTADSPAWQYRIGKDYDISDWIYPAVKRIIIRKNVLRREELSLLNHDEVFRLIDLRERNLLLQVRVNDDDVHIYPSLPDPELIHVLYPQTQKSIEEIFNCT